MKKYNQSTEQSIANESGLRPDISDDTVSSACLCGYRRKSFEITMKDFWKHVAGFSCGWKEEWDEDFSPDIPLTEDEKEVTFLMTIRTEAGEEIERGRLYMVYNAAANTLAPVGFIDRNDGYVQEFTAEKIETALKTVFDEYN